VRESCGKLRIRQRSRFARLRRLGKIKKTRCREHDAQGLFQRLLVRITSRATLLIDLHQSIDEGRIRLRAAKRTSAEIRDEFTHGLVTEETVLRLVWQRSFEFDPIDPHRGR